MPEVSTKVDLCQGHDACPPRPFATFSENVLAETFEVARETDALQSHGCPAHVPHGAAVTRGYPSVTVNGHPIAYIGASVSCPSSIVATGRPSVLVGEGATTARGALEHGAPATAGQGAPKGSKSLDERTRRQLTPTEGTCRGRPLYQQAMQKSCAIASMRMILNERTGQSRSEAEVLQSARNHELVDASDGTTRYGPVYSAFRGTYNEGTAGVLTTNGVPAYTVNTPKPVTPQYIQQVTANSTQPAVMIVTLDPTSPEPEPHAVVVDGIDKDGNVLVRDPWPGGAAGCQRIPFDQFQRGVIPGSEATILGKEPAGQPPRPYITRPRQKK